MWWWEEYILLREVRKTAWGSGGRILQAKRSRIKGQRKKIK
jgi:hypothetical protein